VHEVLTKPKAVVHRPARTDWKSLGEILRGAEAANLSRAVRLAHRLCAFSVQRVSNVVQAEWSEFDLEASPALWTIPRGKMKVQGRVFAHKVFLGQSIVAELRAWRSVSSGKRFVFPSPAGGKRGRPYISREALEKAYRETLRLRDQHTPHGWRSSFSTLARDHGHEREVVELAQDRIHDNEVARAYDRGERLAKRISLMKWWDAGLTRAEGGADILPLKPSRQSKAA
jgi:integrase